MYSAGRIGALVIAFGIPVGFRIPVNSALTGNDRDCRISDY